MAMKDAPSIVEIIVTLDDGRWQRFSAEDLETVREFAGLTKQWRLLEFITQLSPPVLAKVEG